MDSQTYRYSRMVRLTHFGWIVAIVINLVIGWTALGGPSAPMGKPVLAIHVWLGLGVTALVLGRLRARYFSPPPPYADGPPRFARLVHSAHAALYGLICVVGVSGALGLLASGGLYLALGLGSSAAEAGPAAIWMLIHLGAVYGLIGLAVAHILGALAHSVIWRDRVLGRMWPPW